MMNEITETNGPCFSSTLPVQVLLRSKTDPQADWREFDRGPGYFHIPPDHEAAVRIQNIDDAQLVGLIEELAPCAVLRFLNLSENRKITDDGIARLSALTQLTMLNLSSCDITNEGLKNLVALPRLRHLNLSYCNRLNNNGVKYLKALTNLTYLDLQGVLKINTAGVKRLERKGLTIHK